MQHEEWWYPWYPVKFRKDTLRLSDMEELIYRRLIDYYMETGGPIPDDDQAIAKIASVGLETWKMAAAMLRPYFGHDQGMLRSRKCDEVLENQRAFLSKQSEKGRAGAAARWGKTSGKKQKNSSGHATAMAQAMPNDATANNKTVHNSKNTPLPPSAVDNPVDSGDNPGAHPDYQDYFNACVACCSLLAVPKLSTDDQELLSGWCSRYDMNGYAMPTLRKAVERYVKKNGKPPNSLKYFDAMLAENEPMPDIAKQLANQLKVTPP